MRTAAAKKKETYKQKKRRLYLVTATRTNSPKKELKKVTNNFYLYEFRSQYDNVPYPEKWMDRLVKLCRNLEVLRKELGNKAIRVTSGYRSPANNKRVGGVTKSYHMSGHASDIKVSGVSSKVVHATILRLIKEGKMDQGGVGLYSTFVHYDIRGHAARWSG